MKLKIAVLVSLTKSRPMTSAHPISDLTKHQKLVVKNLTAYEDERLSQSQTRHMFQIRGDDIILPLGLAGELDLTSPKNGPWAVHSDRVKFTGKLKPEQEEIAQEALARLSTHPTCFLELPTNTGKTCLAVWLSCRLGLKTLFLCHLDLVNRQTVNEFHKFSTQTPHLVTTISPRADVFIVGLRKAHNLIKQNPNIFQDVGTVFLDEAHLCPQFTYTKLLFGLCPKYLIGLSATPLWSNLTRPYFTNPITRFKTKKFVVVKCKTNFVPDTDKKVYFDGRWRVDWTTAMSSLADNQERNDFILGLIREHLEHKLLVLCDRVAQCEYIHSCLSSQGVTTDILVGRKKQHDDSVNVLVAGAKKAGIGFNDPTRTALILCFDRMDIRQNEGRIRTDDNLILDIVDDNPTLEKHWLERRKWYESRGATIIEPKSTSPKRSGKKSKTTSTRDPPKFIFQSILHHLK